MSDREREALRERLVRAYPSVRRFAAVVADRDVDPDDVAQEVCVRVLEAAARGHGPSGDVSAYCRRAVLAVCANRRRSLARQWTAWARHGPPQEAVDSYHPSEVSVLDQLSPVQRAVLFLVDVEGYTSGETAVIIDSTDAAVRQIASRARRQLRADRDEHVEEGEDR